MIDKISYYGGKYEKGYCYNHYYYSFDCWFLYLQNKRPEKITNAKAAMEKYLSEKGSKDGDYDLFVDYRLDNKMLGYGGYVIKVIFKDEPSVTYVYDYTGEKKISSRSMVDNANPDNKSFKHEN